MTLKVNSLTEELFPKINYEQKQVATSEILHHLIVHKQKVETIAKWIKNRDITTRSVNQLSPLDLCALLDRVDVAQELLKRKISPSEPDLMGRTPLHYASLLHGETSPIFSCLKTALKSHESADEILRGTNPRYLNLTRLLDRTLPNPIDPVFYHRKNGEIVQGTAQEFNQMTGAQYSDRILTIPNDLIKDWLSVEQSQPPATLKAALLAGYRDLTRQPSQQFYLDQDPTINQLGVFAREDVNVGEILFVYTGEQRGIHNQNDNAYYMAHTDGERVRNLAPQINHGFPNAVSYLLPQADGYSVIPLIVAIEPILKGDQICIHYGKGHSIVRSRDRKELRKPAFLEFIQRDPSRIYEDAVSLAKEIYSKPNPSFKNIIIGDSPSDKLRYLFEDPYAFRLMIETHMKDLNYLNKVVEALTNIQLLQVLSIPTFMSMQLITLTLHARNTQSINEKMFEQILLTSNLIIN